MLKLRSCRTLITSQNTSQDVTWTSLSQTVCKSFRKSLWMSLCHFNAPLFSIWWQHPLLVILGILIKLRTVFYASASLMRFDFCHIFLNGVCNVSGALSALVVPSWLWFYDFSCLWEFFFWKVISSVIQSRVTNASTFRNKLTTITNILVVCDIALILA